MGKTVELRIFTLTDIGQADVTKVLWEHLARAPVAPAKYDTIEKAKLSFSSESYVDAATLYNEEHVLFVTGVSRAYQAMFSKQPKNIATWDFFFDPKELLLSRGAAWLNWIKSLLSELSILYGFLCSEEEYDAKHQVVKYYEGGGSSSGEVGMAIRDFWHFLPGVYWLNMFGPEAIYDIDLAKIRKLEDWQLDFQDYKLLTIQHRTPILPFESESRAESDRKLREALGVEYVFSRDESVDNLRQLPGILKALQL